MGAKKGTAPWNKGKTRVQKGWNYVDVQDILSGKSPWTESNKLKGKLFDAGIKQKVCECCGLAEWNGKLIPLELNHVNGISSDNSLGNLEILCPNCHAQTDTYKAKNKGNGRHSRRERYAEGKSF